MAANNSQCKVEQASIHIHTHAHTCIHTKKKRKQEEKERDEKDKAEWIVESAKCSALFQEFKELVERGINSKIDMRVTLENFNRWLKENNLFDDRIGLFLLN